MPDWFNWLAERAARFRGFSRLGRPYLLEMIFYLFAARLALRVIPFRWLTWFFELPPRRPADTFAERERLRVRSKVPYETCKNEIIGTERARFRKGVRWYIKEASWFLPGQTVCFPKAIAAQAFLRRFGMGTTLYYGAATLPERGLTAHVWLQDGDQVIVGHTNGQDYHILARYPEPDALPDRGSMPSTNL
jgi:hypothetical protein